MESREKMTELLSTFSSKMYLYICVEYKQEFIIMYRGEYPTLIYPGRRAYRKVMMQQQGFVVCDIPEVKNLLKSASFQMLRTVIFANNYASNTFASCLGILLAWKEALRAQVSSVDNGVTRYALNQYLVQLMTSFIIQI